MAGIHRKNQTVMADILQMIACTEGGRSKSYALLVEGIRELINKDFEQLVQVLYRIDVSEKKLKETLKTHSDQDAAVLIADLIIARQAEKKSVRNNDKRNNDIREEDRW